MSVLDSTWKKPISLTSTLADWMVAMTEFCVAVTAGRVAGRNCDGIQGDGCEGVNTVDWYMEEPVTVDTEP